MRLLDACQDKSPVSMAQEGRSSICLKILSSKCQSLTLVNGETVTTTTIRTASWAPALRPKKMAEKKKPRYSGWSGSAKIVGRRRCFCRMAESLLPCVLRLSWLLCFHFRETADHLQIRVSEIACLVHRHRTDSRNLAMTA